MVRNVRQASADPSDARREKLTTTGVNSANRAAQRVARELLDTSA